MPSRLALAVVLLLGLIRPAAADAIDGHWCDAGKQHLEINGPSIVTPSGGRLTGDYNRHGFKYMEPGGEKPVVMVLLNEVTMHLKAGDGEEQTWHRCAAPTSQRQNNVSGVGNG
jgi:hypothetical protein